MIRVVVAVISNSEGKLLIQQRPEGKAYSGYWEFPGGKVEAGEKPSAALVRELREELNINLANNIFHHLKRVTEKSIVLDFYHCQLNHKISPQGLEGQIWRWEHLKNLNNYQLPTPNYALLKILNSNHSKTH